MIAENDGAFTWIDSQKWGWNLQFHSYIHSFWVHNVDRTRISCDLASPNIDPAMSAGRFPLKKVLRVYVSWGDSSSTHFCWRNLEIQMVLDKITIPGHWQLEKCWDMLKFKSWYLAIDGFPKNVLLNATPQDGEIDPKFFEDVDIKKLGTLKLWLKDVWIILDPDLDFGLPRNGGWPICHFGHSGWERYIKYTQYMKQW